MHIFKAIPGIRRKATMTFDPFVALFLLETFQQMREFPTSLMKLKLVSDLIWWEFFTVHSELWNDPLYTLIFPCIFPCISWLSLEFLCSPIPAAASTPFQPSPLDWGPRLSLCRTSSNGPNDLPLRCGVPSSPRSDR